MHFLMKQLNNVNAHLNINIMYLVYVVNVARIWLIKKNKESVFAKKMLLLILQKHVGSVIMDRILM